MKASFAMKYPAIAFTAPPRDLSPVAPSVVSDASSGVNGATRCAVMATFFGGRI